MRLLCYGDSNTYGFDPRSYLGGRYPASERWVDLLAVLCGMDCENLGANGRTIPLRPMSRGPAPDEGLIIMLGTNDILQGLAPAECARRMEVFLSGCEKGRALVVAPPPLEPGSWVADNALTDASRALAGLYGPLAARLGQGFADASAWEPRLAFDGVHLLPEGHRALALGISRAVKRFFIDKEA